MSEFGLRLETRFLLCFICLAEVYAINLCHQPHHRGRSLNWYFCAEARPESRRKLYSGECVPGLFRNWKSGATRATEEKRLECSHLWVMMFNWCLTCLCLWFRWKWRSAGTKSKERGRGGWGVRRAGVHSIPADRWGERRGGGRRGDRNQTGTFSHHWLFLSSRAESLRGGSLCCSVHVLLQVQLQSLLSWQSQVILIYF